MARYVNGKLLTPEQEKEQDRIYSERNQFGTELSNIPTRDRAHIGGTPEFMALQGQLPGGQTSGMASSNPVSDIQRAYEAKGQLIQDNYNSSLGDIKQSSDDNRSGVYVNSRLSAIGNNEQLASQGLASGLYGNPTSGRSESSRINQDVALGNNINAVNRQQTALETQAKNLMNSGIVDNQLEMAKVIAEMKANQSQMEKSEFTNTIGAYGQDFQAKINEVENDGDPSNDWQIPYLQSARQDKKSGIAQAQAEAEQQAFENQLKLMQTQYNISKPYYAPSRSTSGSSGGYDFSKLPESLKSKLSDSQISGLSKNADGENFNVSDTTERNKLIGNFIQARASGLISQDDLQAGLYSTAGINLNFGGEVSSATEYDAGKVKQLFNGLATLRMQGGTNEQLATKAQELYERKTISELEMLDILSRFGLM